MIETILWFLACAAWFCMGRATKRAEIKRDVIRHAFREGYAMGLQHGREEQWERSQVGMWRDSLMRMN